LLTMVLRARVRAGFVAHDANARGKAAISDRERTKEKQKGSVDPPDMYQQRVPRVSGAR
jgi:hypothetical protein